VEGFIRYLKLSHDQGALTGEKVRILTAHAAKGLEFKCVFIAGLAEGVFPLAGEDTSQERNLFYVAMTRAVSLLYLVCPPGPASSFVLRVPGEFCTIHEEASKSRSEQMLLFES
jgi:DNA helicase II / ATP-dependent DNA helicase PcrA